MTDTTDPQTARFRHRIPEVEAVQWTGSNAEQLRAFCGPDFDEIDLDDRTEDPDQTAAVREADHGTWRGLAPGDWVVRLDGGLYEFAAADFAKQYEPAPSAAVSPPPADRAASYRLAADAIERMRGYPHLILPEEIVAGLRLLATGAQPEPGSPAYTRRLAAGERDEQQAQQDGAETRDALMRAHTALAEQAGRDQAALAKVRGWVTSDVVTAVSGFGDGYREAQRDIRDLIEPGTEAQQPEEPSPEETVRGHVLALHQIGEQLAGIESWMWEHLADVRDAAAPVAGQPPADTGEEEGPRFVRVCIVCPECDHTLDENGVCANGCRARKADRG